MPQKTRVLVVDDSALMRGLLSQMIGLAPDMEVVGAAPDAPTAREMIKALNPDVLTLDVQMPKMDGLEFLERLMRLRPMPVHRSGVRVAGWAQPPTARTIKPPDSTPAGGCAAERTTCFMYCVTAGRQKYDACSTAAGLRNACARRLSCGVAWIGKPNWPQTLMLQAMAAMLYACIAQASRKIRHSLCPAGSRT